MTGLVRWIVRDWTSCFLTCRFPLDDHQRALSPRVAVRNMAIDKRKDKSFNTNHNHKNNMSRPSKKCNNLRQLNKAIVIKDSKNGVHIGNRFDYSSWSFSADEEDFVVFCFGEDGACDVVKDNNGMHKNSRPLNRKGEEKEGRQQYRESTGRVCQVEGIEDCGMMVCGESRGSDQSESSTGSFAFPVLGWEWIGSPVQMPKSQGGQHLKKQKARVMPFQCCRF